MSQQPVYTADEFESEARYIDRLIWEALAIEPGTKVLLCGYGPEGAYAKRAIATGAKVTVIEHRNEAINQYAKLDAKLLRGSTSVIPAKENSFDVAIAFHYLHEIDPFFHAQVLAELARVARRVVVVEPAPPADPLGKRIALLYSQAKRELGQFEYYQPLEYWKKLLQSVKADVSQHVFAFAKVPPREYLSDTVELMLHTIEVEDAPPEYVQELRQIAKRSDAQLLPPPRYVLAGAAAGELVLPKFTQRPTTSVTAKPSKAIPAPKPRAEVSEETGYEFPPVPVPRGKVTPPETITPPAAAAPTAPPGRGRAWFRTVDGYAGAGLRRSGIAVRHPDARRSRSRRTARRITVRSPVRGPGLRRPKRIRFTPRRRASHINMALGTTREPRGTKAVVALAPTGYCDGTSKRTLLNGELAAQVAH